MTTQSPELKQLYADYRHLGFDAAEALELAQGQLGKKEEKKAPQPQEGTQAKSKAAPANVQKSTGLWALGIVLLAFGGIGWIFGGVFTFDGWITWLNSIFSIVRLPFVIPAAAGLWRLLFIPLAVIYSRVETKHRPVWRGNDKRWHIEPPIFWVGFILITLTDIGSTAVGLQTTTPAAWGALAPTVAWVIGAGVRVGAVATVLTFAPEWLILAGVWLLKR